MSTEKIQNQQTNPPTIILIWFSYSMMTIIEALNFILFFKITLKKKSVYNTCHNYFQDVFWSCATYLLN